MTHTVCPSAAELQRAFFVKDRIAERDAASCPRCAEVWAEVASLAELAEALRAPPPSDDRREQLRTLLTSQAPIVVPRTRRVALISAAAAASIAVGVGLANMSSKEHAHRAVSTRAPGETSRSRAVARPIGDAEFWTEHGPPKEILRLRQGTLAVLVGALAEGEQFRVSTADGDVEVDVEGGETAFEVIAKDDRLREVWVSTGLVELRNAGALVAVVRQGERWRALDSAPPAASPPPRTATPAPTPAPAPTPNPNPNPNPTASATPTPAPRKEPPVRASQEAASSPPTSASRAEDPYDLGWAHLRSQRFDAAAAAFAEAVRVARDDLSREDARYFLAVSLARSGKTEEAADALETFLSEHSTSARAGEAASILGWLWFDRGDAGRAREMFERASRSGSPRAQRSASDGLEAIQRRVR